MDPSNCGGCGKACAAGQVCSAGACGVECSGGSTLCGSTCVDTKVDPANCGGCEKACAAGHVCSASACGVECSGGTTLCGSACVDTQQDPANCGGCNMPCAAGEVCSSGSCGLSCTGGSTLCGSTCVQLSNDPANCGGCGNACGSAHATAFCSGAACGLSCTAGFADCAVYCAGMSTGTPQEYLSLVHTYVNGAPASNFSAYYCKNCTDNAWTYFEKVKIDPTTLSVDVTDTTFAVMVTNDPTCWASIGGACASGRTNRFANGANCIPNGPGTPGDVDLRGTPFSIDPSVTMVDEGWYAYGKGIFSADRKQLSFTGGGNCGGIHPENWVFLLKQDE